MDAQESEPEAGSAVPHYAWTFPATTTQLGRWRDSWVLVVVLGFALLVFVLQRDAYEARVADLKAVQRETVEALTHVQETLRFNAETMRQLGVFPLAPPTAASSSKDTGSSTAPGSR